MSTRLVRIFFSLAFLTISIIMPAQPLPSLPTDGRIRKGTLRCGVKYYMVSSDAVKGYADFAVVRRGVAPPPAEESVLQTAWLSRHGIGPRRDGYYEDNDGSTVLHLDNVPVYDANVLDSTLLVAFGQLAASRADEALILSGDLDPAELEKKLDIFSMLVPQHFVESSRDPDYVWEPSVMPSVFLTPVPMGEKGLVRVAYASPRTPHDLMNTAQALVMGILSREFQTIAARRIERNLRKDGVPYGSLDVRYLNSTETGDDEQYSVEVLTDRQHLEAAMKTVSRTLAGLDGFGVPAREFSDAKNALRSGMRRRGTAPLSNREYVDRCTAHFLYGANLAPYSEELRLFERKNVADTTQTRLFNQFATSLLSQLSNLTLEYRADLDSLDEDNALFQYNLAYLYGSTFREPGDYTWQRDTTGLEARCRRVRIRETKPEPVSGGTLWTFSNGIRVAYRHLPGSGGFHYALLLGGGLSGVQGLTEGEGGYIGDMLSLVDAGGLSAPEFRDHLAVNGIRMQADVNLTYTSIHGDAPSSKLPTLLKALLALANDRTLNRDEFDIFLRNAAWAEESPEDRLYALMHPGFSYSTGKKPEALGAATPVKAAQFFESLFSRVNDGMLILSGDVDEATVRRTLQKYLGGFRTQRTALPRKTVRYQVDATTRSRRSSGGRKGLWVRLDTEYPLSGVHYAVAEAAAEALRRRLVEALDGTGLPVRVTAGFQSHPQERLWMVVACEGEQAGKALPALREGIRKAAAPLPQKDVDALRAMVSARTEAELAREETMVGAMVARYGIGKDLVSHYKESVSGITAGQISEMLSALAAGPAAEYIVE